MILRCLSQTRARLAAVVPSRSRARIFGLALLAALAGACGGQSSTDTGNPPVSLGQKLRLTATEAGVRVSGEPGTVAGGARVDVVNTATGESATTTAAPDGSFELEIEGSVQDEFQVYAASSGQSWRTRLTSSGPATAQTGLAGLEFLLSSADGYTLLPDTTVRLSFGPSELSFGAGCNGFSGEYSLCDGRLCVPILSGTEIGCDPERHTQDEWLAAFLRSSPELTQAGASLTLAGAQATLEFLDRELADPDRPLTGRTWSVDTWIEAGAATNFPLQLTPTLEFGSDGSLTVFTGCNTGLGSYTRSGQTLSITPLAYTDAACTGGAATSQERIQRVLTEGDVSFEVDAARLTITRGALGLGAITD